MDFSKLSPSDWAAWAQAVGSGLALVIAVSIAAVEARRTRIGRREAARAAELTAFLAIINANSLAGVVAREMKDPVRSLEYAIRHVPQMFDEAAEILRSVDLANLGPRQAMLVVQARANFSTLRGTVNNMCAHHLAGTIVPGSSSLDRFVANLKGVSSQFGHTLRYATKADLEEIVAAEAQDG